MKPTVTRELASRLWPWLRADRTGRAALTRQVGDEQAAILARLESNLEAARRGAGSVGSRVGSAVGGAGRRGVMAGDRKDGETLRLFAFQSYSSAGVIRAASKERAEEIARSGERRRERSLYVYELQDIAEEGVLREKKQ